MTFSNREVTAWIRFVSYNCAINLGYITPPPFFIDAWETYTSEGSVLPTMTLSDKLKDVAWALPRGSARLESRPALLATPVP